MSTPNLYRVEKTQLPQLANLFTQCFGEDPLYQRLIPNPLLRQKVLLGYFTLYLNQYSGHCQILADSPDLQGAVVAMNPADLAEEATPQSRLRELTFLSKLATYLLIKDKSGKTLWAFWKNRQYLTSKWAEFIGPGHLHVDMLAVSPQSRGKGIAGKLLRPLLNEADRLGYPVTLETHNPKNLSLYRHFGFAVVETLGEGDLRQYCLERPA